MEEGLSIGTVERETGVAKDTLRVWEKRYGFPAPGRDSNGERIYGRDQVEKLILIKRLIDRGARRVDGLHRSALWRRRDSSAAAGCEALGAGCLDLGRRRAGSRMHPVRLA